MKNSTSKILIVAVILLLIANLVMVFMMVKKKGKRGYRKEERSNGPREMFKELDLSPDQKKAYDQLKEEHFRNTRPLFDSIRAAKAVYFSMVKDSTVNDSLFLANSDQIRQKQAAADRMIFNHFRQIRKLLTAEQQVKFDSLVQKMMHRGPRKKSDN